MNILSTWSNISLSEFLDTEVDVHLKQQYGAFVRGTLLDICPNFGHIMLEIDCNSAIEITLHSHMIDFITPVKSQVTLDDALRIWVEGLEEDMQGRSVTFALKNNIIFFNAHNMHVSGGEVLEGVCKEIAPDEYFAIQHDNITVTALPEDFSLFLLNPESENRNATTLQKNIEKYKDVLLSDDDYHTDSLFLFIKLKLEGVMAHRNSDGFFDYPSSQEDNKRILTAIAICDEIIEHLEVGQEPSDHLVSWLMLALCDVHKWWD